MLTLLMIGLCAPGQAAELSISESQLPVALGQYLDYVEDPDAILTMEDILSADLDWQRSVQDTPTLGMSMSAHWFYLELRPRGIIEAPLVLRLQAATMDQADFYFVRDGEVIASARTGDTVAFDELTLPYRYPVVPIEFDLGTEPVSLYLRAFSAGGVEIPLSLTTMNDLLLEQQGQLTFFGAFFAFFFACLCVSAVLYSYLKNGRYLGYTLFFAGALPFFLAQFGMGRVWLWGDFPDMNNRVTYLSAVVLIASFCQLGQTMNQEGRYRDQIAIVLRFISLAMIPTALWFLFLPIAGINAGTIITLMALGLSSALTAIVLTGLNAARGSRAALYLFSCWTLIILAYLTLIAYKFSLVERSEITSYVGQGLMILAAFMLLLSLGEFVRAKNEELAQIRLETRAKGDFLKHVSREFLTPVHLILANSKRLLAAQYNDMDPGTREHMQTVVKQSDHLHKLINDLLEMAELESDNFEPQYELVEISQFINEIRELLLPAALEKNLKLETEFASSNLLLQTDRSRLQHILINIVTNAIKFTDEGSVKLTYKAIYFRRRLGIEIIVSDTGRGMSEEFQRRIFREFSREEPGTEKDPQGTGLGMVIVKRMLERLGGEISFESSQSRGSAFFLRLPLRVMPD